MRKKLPETSLLESISTTCTLLKINFRNFCWEYLESPEISSSLDHPTTLPPCSLLFPLFYTLLLTHPASGGLFNTTIFDANRLFFKFAKSSTKWLEVVQRITAKNLQKWPAFRDLWAIAFIFRDYPFRTYSKVLEKLAFLIPRYPCKGARIRL